MPIKIAIGSDHGGYLKKKELVSYLAGGYKVVDVGCHSEDSCDYPDYAGKVAALVSANKVDKGILLCGTGIGMSITANKFAKVRAAVCWNVKTAGLASEHNNANVLCLSGRFIPLNTLKKMVKKWIATPFAGGRHLRRINKIRNIEKKQAGMKGSRD